MPITFDPANKLVFAAGVLVGTSVPCNGRTTVTTIFPTCWPKPLVGSGHMGGHFAAKLKYAGYDALIVEGKADAVRACVEELKDQLLGREAGNIEELWQTMYRCNFYRGGPVLTSAMSGIEQALWDVKGKALGVPVYELLVGLWTTLINNICPSIKNISYFSAYDEDVLE